MKSVAPFFAVFAMFAATTQAQAVECAGLDLEGTWKNARGEKFAFEQDGCKTVTMTDANTGWKYEFNNAYQDWRAPNSFNYAPGAYVALLSGRTGLDISSIEYFYGQMGNTPGSGADFYLRGTFSVFGFSVKLGALARVNLIQKNSTQVLQLQIKDIGRDQSAATAGSNSARWLFKGIDFALTLFRGLIANASFDVLQRRN
jgi:hypothetical protein